MDIKNISLKKNWCIQVLSFLTNYKIDQNKQNSHKPIAGDYHGK